MGVYKKKFLKTISLRYLCLTEGGRLEKELSYVTDHLGAGAGATSQMVIQTPRNDHGSVLTPDSLLAHLRVLRAASRVVVDTGDT